MEILKEIKPSKIEEAKIKKIVKDFLDRLNRRLDKAKAIAGGSYAKGTWLKGEHDIDIFVRFKEDEDSSKKLKLALKKGFKQVKELYGSRHYFQVRFKDIDFEVVPVLEIKKAEEAINVTDVSFLHVEYVKKASAKLKDEIRLVKKFCKANELYGAETHIKGFSGYVLEILVIYYGGFEKFIKWVSDWGDKVIIDPAKFYKGKNEILKSLNVSKRKGPLILIDPVQKERNASAAVNKEKFLKLKELCKIYDGDKSFFIKKEFNLEMLRDYFVFEINPLTGRKDVVGGKLLKAFEYMKRSLDKRGFHVLDSGWHWNKRAYFWFKCLEVLPEKEVHYGPFVKDGDNVERFKEKWKGYRLCKGKERVYVVKERAFFDVEKYFEALLKSVNVKQKVRFIKKVR